MRQFADKCEHRLFLSATPHNGHPESFTALMEMIDPRRFSRGALLDSKALKEVTVRRLKSDLKGKGFKARQVKPLPFTPDDSEQEMFSLLDEIVTRSAKLNGTKPGGDIVAMLLKMRFLSSPFSFGMTLSHYVSSKAGRGSPMTTTTTSSVRASPTRGRACGSTTKLSASASRRFRIH